MKHLMQAILEGALIIGTSCTHLMQAQAPDFSLVSSRSDVARINFNPAYIPVDGLDYIHVIDGSLHLSSSKEFVQGIKEINATKRLVVEDVINGLSQAPFHQDFRANILSSGFKTDMGFFNFQISARSNNQISIDPHLAQFIAEGNGRHLGEKVEMGSVNLHGIEFMEYDLGYSNYIAFDDYGDMKLTFGARFKYLSGFMATQSQKGYFSVTTDKNGEKITVESDQQIYVHAPITYEKNANGTINTNSMNFFKEVDMSNLFFKNTGWGCDLGVEFQIMPSLRIGVALNDIGMIRWSDEIKSFQQTLKGENAIVYEGEDISNIVTGKEEQYQSKPLQKISEQVADNFYESEGEAFTTTLPTRFHASIEYQPVSEFIITGVFGSNRILGQNHPWAAVIGTMQPSDSFGCSVSMSTRKENPFALGAGIVFGRNFQISLSADNLLAIGFSPLFVNPRMGVALRF